MPGYARRAEGVANPVGGKLLPDNLTTQANVVRYPLYSRHFTFIVEANQPKAIRDYAVTIAPVEARQPACLAIRENLEGLPLVRGKLLPDTFPTRIDNTD